VGIAVAFVEVARKTIESGGMTIGYLEAGEGPLVLLIHGFPDTADSWRPTIAGLVEAGFRAVAPFTRGIRPTTSPPKGDFASISMAKDILGLLDALGEERCMLVGQDWGAMFSYIAANLAPDRIDKLVTIAIPHPRSIKPRLGLIRSLWHFFFFQLPWAPEWFMRRKDFSGVDHFFRAWSPSTDWSGRLESIKEVYRAPGTLAASLGYYRWMVMAPWTAKAKEQQRMITQKVSVPTLTFAGLTDGALPAVEFDRSPGAFTGPYELVKVPEGGHFLHLERPDLFLPKLIDFLKNGVSTPPPERA
jgi:pimeloyl-ACP methyl ester carboxylesterase